MSSDFCTILYIKLTHSFFILFPRLIEFLVFRFKHPVFFAYLEDPGTDGRIILRWIFRNWDLGGMDWIDMPQHRER
jgi:hypothetical protein